MRLLKSPGMRRFSSLLLCLLLSAPVLADEAQEFLERAMQFNLAVAKAQTMQDLHPKFSQQTIAELASWPAELQRKTLALMQETALGEHDWKSQIVKFEREGSSASLSFRATTTTEHLNAEANQLIDFTREGEVWRVDYREDLKLLKQQAAEAP